MTFKLLKSVKCSLLILALTIGCKPEEINEPTVYNVDASLAKYVDKFFQEANSRGITISMENLIVKPAINTSEIP